MGQTYDEIDDALQSWICAQRLWFVATAPLAGDGLVNVSPRGHDTLSVLGPQRVGWVDYTGSGVETIAHLRENGRICLMFASFDRRPRIVRLHGHGHVVPPGQPEYRDVTSRHPLHPSNPCGDRRVPVMDLVEERDLLRLYAEKKGQEGMATYRTEKNSHSIDGLPGV